MRMDGMSRNYMITGLTELSVDIILYLYLMKIVITESKLTEVLYEYLDWSFQGFNKCYYVFTRLC